VNNFEILQNYSKGDLRRLAKGKISEIVGLDSDKVLRDLSRVLGNYESVKRSIEFRTPPTDTILEVLLDAPEHRVSMDDLQQAVTSRIQQYVEASKSLDFKNTKKNYGLYAKMLIAAWDFDDDFNASEANLLRVLRNDLGITRKEHQLVMAHSTVRRLKFDTAEYEAGLTFLTNEGIVLVCCGDNDSSFILSDETSDSLLELWGFALRGGQRERLFAHLSKPQLVGALKNADLRTSGSNPELVARLIENEIPANPVLSGLSTDELVGLLGKLGLPKSGNKEERVLRIIDHFKANADIAVAAASPEAEAVAPQEEILREETVLDLLDQLGVVQLADALESLGLQKSGSKNARIERLALSPYNSETVLASLGLDDLRKLATGLGLRKSGNKSDLINSILAYFMEQSIEESALSPKDLLGFYDEISRQDVRAYPANATPDGLSATRMGLDFERATRYIFKNMLRLDAKAQTSGQVEPDGTVTDDEGLFYCYECKTVLNPPYTLPIQHRLQLRNYISSIAASRRSDRFGGYLIIAHSFSDGIEQKLASIEAPMDVPIAVVEARDLLAAAVKWQEEHPLDTFPIGRALKNGRVSAKDLVQASRV